MKKAKIMLLTIAVLASVGGALAFKVQKFGTKKYCYITTESEPDKSICTFTVTQGGAKPWISGNKLFYTETTDLNQCGDLTCPNLGAEVIIW